MIIKLHHRQLPQMVFNQCLFCSTLPQIAKHTPGITHQITHVYMVSRNSLHTLLIACLYENPDKTSCPRFAASFDPYPSNTIPIYQSRNKGPRPCQRHAISTKCPDMVLEASIKYFSITLSLRLALPIGFRVIIHDTQNLSSLLEASTLPLSGIFRTCLRNSLMLRYS